ncbi:MAG: serine/threonine protein kinase [Myxococcales bacterium]|nr:serine/threonine protein kinase [Myxococcales bacterium]
MTSYQLAPTPEARPAPTRLGRYDLIGHLATGGMAEIHLARLSGEEGFWRLFVVKRLLPELCASREYIAMLFDEGRIAGRLNHPNVCEVYELGRDGVEYFLVMPYLDGIPLHDLIARPREADRLRELRIWAGVIIQACAGLHYAHELRDEQDRLLELVHRDISPSNVFVTADGLVKVLDFGIAKVLGSSVTEAGTIKGKTQYMSPEQLLGKPLDRRADLFSLGIVMFELATHQRLFKRDSEYLSARAILEDAIPRADAVDPAIPTEVADVIARALARDPRDRHGDAKELALAIVDAMAKHGGVATPAEIAAVVTSTDELTAQRTRQAKIVDVARAQPIEVATRPMRGEKTIVSPPPTHAQSFSGWRRGVTIALIATLALSVLFGLLVRAVISHTSEPATAAHAGSAASGSTSVEPEPEPEPGSDSESGSAAESASGSGSESASGSGSESGSGAAAGSAATAAAGSAPRSGTSRPARPGTFSIESTPFATIFLDGKRLDVTPMVGYRLPAGRHRLRAVLVDGRAKELTVDVPAGQSARPIHLTW